MEDVLTVYHLPYDPKRPVDKVTITEKACAWKEWRNRLQVGVDWQFTADDARIKPRPFIKLSTLRMLVNGTLTREQLTENHLALLFKQYIEHVNTISSQRAEKNHGTREKR